MTNGFMLRQNKMQSGEFRVRNTIIYLLSQFIVLLAQDQMTSTQFYQAGEYEK